jgi:Fungal specific transcription factor domain/Fungal Zn(2)-Cys(6) binuclear cluster domain
MLEDQLSRLACDRCYRRKARCDRALPSCSTCIRAGTGCRYDARGGLVRSEDLETLRRRLRQLENKNRVLSKRLREGQHASGAADETASDDVLDATAGTMEIPDDNNEGGDKSETENDNEVAKQVYSLSLNAGRPGQYLGSASGAILANLLPIGARPWRTVRDNDDDEDSFGRFASASGQRFSSPAMARSVLPAEPLAQSLLAAYLSHDHLAFPYFHPRKLIDSLTSMYSDEKYYESHPVEAFALDMIFAIATVQVHRFSWQSLPDAETYHERAISKLGTVLESGGLIALQTIMLLCQYRMLSVSYSTSASLWHLLGMATRLGLELGLHREAVYQLPVGLSPADEDRVRLELGIKRRCFWSLFQMDRIVSNTLGRPLAINLVEIDTEFPTVEEDSEASWGPSPTPEDMLKYPHWPANTKIFNHITRHRVITGKILANLHNMPKSRMPDPQISITIKKQLAEELDLWRAGVASLPLVDASVARSKDKSNYRTHEWYNLLYHNCILMLHRPIHSLQDIPQTSEILAQIYYSCQQSISSYADLHKARKINYTWITLHAVFLVALSYVYALRTHFQNKRRQRQSLMEGLPPTFQAQLTSEPSINQIVSDMRACSTVLVALSERWNLGRGCHEVFARLSDAVLGDASEYFMNNGQAKAQNISSADEQGRLNGQFLSGDQASQQSHWSLITDFDRNYQDYFKEFQELFGDQYNDNALPHPPFDWNFEI